jgi:hypothetical protein
MPFQAISSRCAAATLLPEPTVEHGVDLLRPVGQWKWALKRLIRNDDPVDPTRRIAALAVFAQQHWPGWFDQPLRHLMEESNVAGSAERAERLITQIDTAALLHSLRRIRAYWLDATARDQLDLTRDTWQYQHQALVTQERAIEMSRSNSWWQTLGAELKGALEEYNEAGGSLGLAGPNIKSIIGRIRESLNSLENMHSQMSDVKASRIVTDTTSVLESLEALDHAARAVRTSSDLPSDPHAMQPLN